MKKVNEMKLSKAIVLENGFEIDIPKKLKSYLEDKGIGWEWKDSRFFFWKENRAATYEYFENLPDGQLLMCSTVFDGLQQLELFIQLFHSLKHKQFTFKIANSCLPNELLKFYEHYESSITPKEYDEDETPDRVNDFKKEINKKFLEVLKAHNIIWLTSLYSDGDEIKFSGIATIKKNCF